MEWVVLLSPVAIHHVLSNHVIWNFLATDSKLIEAPSTA